MSKAEGKFGFRKLAIFASRRGKLVALETKTGSIVWQMFIPDFEPRLLTLVRGERDSAPSLLGICGFQKEVFLFN
jgi:hypothetical protein